MLPKESEVAASGYFTIEDEKNISLMLQDGLLELLFDACNNKAPELLEEIDRKIDKYFPGAKDNEKKLLIVDFANCLINTARIDKSFKHLYRDLIDDEDHVKLFFHALRSYFGGQMAVANDVDGQNYFENFLEDIIRLHAEKDFTHFILISLYNLSKDDSILRRSAHPVARRTLDNECRVLDEEFIKYVVRHHSWLGNFLRMAEGFSELSELQKVVFILQGFDINSSVGESGRVVRIEKSPDINDKLLKIQYAEGYFRQIIDVFKDRDILAADARFLKEFHYIIRVNYENKIVAIPFPFLHNILFEKFCAKYLPLDKRSEVFSRWVKNGLRPQNYEGKRLDLKFKPTPPLKLNFANLAKICGCDLQNDDGFIVIPYNQRAEKLVVDFCVIDLPYIWKEMDDDGSIKSLRIHEKFLERNLFSCYDLLNCEYSVFSDVDFINSFAAQYSVLEKIKSGFAFKAIVQNFLNSYVFAEDDKQILSKILNRTLLARLEKISPHFNPGEPDFALTAYKELVRLVEEDYTCQDFVYNLLGGEKDFEVAQDVEGLLNEIVITSKSPYPLSEDDLRFKKVPGLEFILVFKGRIAYLSILMVDVVEFARVGWYQLRSMLSHEKKLVMEEVHGVASSGFGLESGDIVLGDKFLIERLNKSSELRSLLRSKSYIRGIDVSVTPIFFGYEADILAEGYGKVEDFTDAFRQIILSACEDHSLREFLAYLAKTSSLGVVICELVEIVNSNPHKLYSLRGFYSYSLDHSGEADILMAEIQRFKDMIISTDSMREDRSSDDEFVAPDLEEYLLKNGLELSREDEKLTICPGSNHEYFNDLEGQLAGMADFEGAENADSIVIYNKANIFFHRSEGALHTISLSQIFDNILFALALDFIDKGNPRLSSDDLKKYFTSFFAAYRFDDEDQSLIIKYISDVNSDAPGTVSSVQEFIEKRDVGFNLQKKLLGLLEQYGFAALASHFFNTNGLLGCCFGYGGFVFNFEPGKELPIDSVLKKDGFSCYKISPNNILLIIANNIEVCTSGFKALEEHLLRRDEAVEIDNCEFFSIKDKKIIDAVLKENLLDFFGISGGKFDIVKIRNSLSGLDDSKRKKVLDMADCFVNTAQRDNSFKLLMRHLVNRQFAASLFFEVLILAKQGKINIEREFGDHDFFPRFLEDVSEACKDSVFIYSIFLNLYGVSRNPEVLRKSSYPIVEALLNRDYTAITQEFVKVINKGVFRKFYEAALGPKGNGLWLSHNPADKAKFILNSLGVTSVSQSRDGDVIKILNRGAGSIILQKLKDDLDWKKFLEDRDIVSIYSGDLLLSFMTININGVEIPFLSDDLSIVGYFCGYYFPLVERGEIFTEWNREVLKLKSLDGELFKFSDNSPVAIPKLTYDNLAVYVGDNAICGAKGDVVTISLVNREFNGISFASLPYISRADSDGAISFKTNENYFNRHLFLVYDKASMAKNIISDLTLLQNFWCYLINLEKFDDIAQPDISVMAANFMNGFVVDSEVRNYIITEVLTKKNIDKLAELAKSYETLHPLENDFAEKMRQKLGEILSGRGSDTFVMKSLFEPEDAKRIRTAKYSDTDGWVITYDKEGKAPAAIKPIKGLRFKREVLTKEKKVKLKIEIDDYLEFFPDGYKQIEQAFTPVAAVASQNDSGVLKADPTSILDLAKEIEEAGTERSKKSQIKFKEPQKDSVKAQAKRLAKKEEEERKLQEKQDAEKKAKKLAQQKIEEENRRKNEEKRLKAKEEEKRIANEKVARANAEREAQKQKEREEKIERDLILKQQEEERRQEEERQRVIAKEIEEAKLAALENIEKLQQEARELELVANQRQVRLDEIISSNLTHDLELSAQEQRCEELISAIKLDDESIALFREKYLKTIDNLKELNRQKRLGARWLGDLGKSGGDIVYFCQFIDSEIIRVNGILRYEQNKILFAEIRAEIARDLENFRKEKESFAAEKILLIGDLEIQHSLDQREKFVEEIEDLKELLKKVKLDEQRMVIELDIAILNLKIKKIDQEQQIRYAEQEKDFFDLLATKSEELDFRRIEVEKRLRSMAPSNDYYKSAYAAKLSEHEAKTLELQRYIASVRVAVENTLQSEIHSIEQEISKTKGSSDSISSHLDGQKERLVKKEKKAQSDTEENQEKINLLRKLYYNPLVKETKDLQQKIKDLTIPGAALGRELMLINRRIEENSRLLRFLDDWAVEFKRREVEVRKYLQDYSDYCLHRRFLTIQEIDAKIVKLEDNLKRIKEEDEEEEIKKLRIARCEKEIYNIKLTRDKELLSIDLEEIVQQKKSLGEIMRLRSDYIEGFANEIGGYQLRLRSLISNESLAEENSRFLALAMATELPEKRSLYYKIPPSLRCVIDGFRSYFRVPAFMHGSIFYKNNPQDTDWQFDINSSTLQTGAINAEKIALLFPALDASKIDVKDVVRSSSCIAHSIKIKGPDDSTILDVTICSQSYASTASCISYYDSVRMGEDGKFYFKEKYRDKFLKIHGVYPEDADAYPNHDSRYHEVIVTEAFQFYLRGAYQLLNNVALTDEGRGAIENGIYASVHTKLLQAMDKEQAIRSILEDINKFAKEHKIVGSESIEDEEVSPELVDDEEVEGISDYAKFRNLIINITKSVKGEISVSAPSSVVEISALRGASRSTTNTKSHSAAGSADTRSSRSG